MEWCTNPNRHNRGPHPTLKHTQRLLVLMIYSLRSSVVMTNQRSKLPPQRPSLWLWAPHRVEYRQPPHRRHSQETYLVEVCVYAFHSHKGDQPLQTSILIADGLCWIGTTSNNPLGETQRHGLLLTHISKINPLENQWHRLQLTHTLTKIEADLHPPPLHSVLARRRI